MHYFGRSGDLQSLTSFSPYFHLKRDASVGPYSSCEEYLDVQFRLLLEDFLRPLRDSVQEINKGGIPMGLTCDILDDVRIHGDTAEISGKLTVLVPIDRNNIADWKAVGMFKTGSLLLLSQDNFNSVKFVVVQAVKINDERKILYDVPVQVIFSKDCQKWKITDSDRFSMIESPAFYAAYSHTLDFLQTVDLINFPMKKYIVDVETRKVAPAHLRRMNEDIDFSILMQDGSSRRAKPSMLRNWPNAAELGLDNSQYEALQKALTQELTIIQGPPGTGKTFTSLQVIKMLLTNDWLCQDSPVLIVSFTNHALDQMLELIFDFVTDFLCDGDETQAQTMILRIGAGSKSKKVQALTRINNNNKLHVKDSVLPKIVGMTTTGAAKNKNMLQDTFKCKIMIVEEAAQILEAHVVACLTQYCQQMILIGDHQQLRPLADDHELGEKYKLNISLMERLIENGKAQNSKNWVQLNEQHRMRPEIANLICPVIYENLKNHPVVFTFPAVNGCDKNIFFLDHQHCEKKVSGSFGFVNIYEACYIVFELQLFVSRGYYKPTQITVIAAYAAQKNEIVNLLKANPQLKEVRVTTVDGYQGEENDIIFLSLVRSNPENDIGFLCQDNRVCVALSRARYGLYMYGNMACLKSSSKTWMKINEILEDTHCIGDYIRWRSHRTKTHTTEPTELQKKSKDCEASLETD